MGRKVSDEFTVPLCSSHHRELHGSGNERIWWGKQGIDPVPVAKELWRERFRVREQTGLPAPRDQDTEKASTSADNSDALTAKEAGQ